MENTKITYNVTVKKYLFKFLIFKAYFRNFLGMDVEENMLLLHQEISKHSKKLFKIKLVK